MSEESMESSDNLFDFYLPDESVKQEENSESSSGPQTKKRKLPSRIKSVGQKSRKLRGRKSYELRRIIDSDVIKFCQDNGLFATSATCSCGKPMTLIHKSHGKNLYLWKCRKATKGKRCDTSFSIRKGTWFEKSKITVSEILWLAYMWVYEYSYNSMLHECDHSTQTIIEWLSACRDVCQSIMECKSEPIGGMGKMVEVFECKFTGKGPENQWVFCALEQGSCRSVLVFVKDNESKSLVQIFDQYILPDSTVLTNIWSAFKNLNKNDFSYLMYQKSITFFDTVKKIEINNIETMIEVANRPPAINVYTKYKYGSNFCEVMYRKSLKFSEDAYITFLQDVAKIYTPITSLPQKLQIKKEDGLDDSGVDKSMLMDEDSSDCDDSSDITYETVTSSNIIKSEKEVNKRKSRVSKKVQIKKEDCLNHSDMGKSVLLIEDIIDCDNSTNITHATSLNIIKSEKIE